MKDTERILLKTFDTLKEYYEVKNKNSEETSSKSIYKCNNCDYETEVKSILKTHVENQHGNTASDGNLNSDSRQSKRSDRDNGNNQERRHGRSRPVCYSPEERKKNGFCIYWNRGFCVNEDRCRFLHAESPNCHFQDNCNRKFNGCTYFRRDLMRGDTFLDQRRFNNRRD